jgi:osmotically-inducible protein OsmY
MNFLFKNFLLLIFSITFLYSCAAVNVTTSSVKEKGIKEAISDGMIDAAINKEFLNHNINMFMNVEIEVVEGRVLLTGSVKQPKHRLDAIKLSWKVLGVREVINEIDITEKGGIKNYLVDVKIKTQIRYKVITDKQILSINYNFEVVNGNLFIIGISKNKKELKRVIEHANNIKGVIKVVSHAIMKDDPRREKYQRKLQKND